MEYRIWDWLLRSCGRKVNYKINKSKLKIAFSVDGLKMSLMIAEIESYDCWKPETESYDGRNWVLRWLKLSHMIAEAESLGGCNWSLWCLKESDDGWNWVYWWLKLSHMIAESSETESYDGGNWVLMMAETESYDGWKWVLLWLYWD